MVDIKKERLTKKIKGAAAIAFIVLVSGIVGNGDYEYAAAKDRQAEQVDNSGNGARL